MGSDTHSAELNQWLKHKVVGSYVKLVELSELKFLNKLSIPFMFSIKSMIFKTLALKGVILWRIRTDFIPLIKLQDFIETPLFAFLLLDLNLSIRFLAKLLHELRV